MIFVVVVIKLADLTHGGPNEISFIYVLMWRILVKETVFQIPTNYSCKLY